MLPNKATADLLGFGPVKTSVFDDKYRSDATSTLELAKSPRNASAFPLTFSRGYFPRLESLFFPSVSLVVQEKSWTFSVRTQELSLIRFPLFLDPQSPADIIQNDKNRIITSLFVHNFCHKRV